jgi:hypothetical protein
VFLEKIFLRLTSSVWNISTGNIIDIALVGLLVARRIVYTQPDILNVDPLYIAIGKRVCFGFFIVAFF